MNMKVDNGQIGQEVYAEVVRYNSGALLEVEYKTKDELVDRWKRKADIATDHKNGVISRHFYLKTTIHENGGEYYSTVLEGGPNGW